MKHSFLFMGLGLTGAYLARAAVQETYSATMRPAVAGFRADMRPAVFASYNCEDADGIGFGLAARQGARPKGSTKGGTGDVLGLTVLQRVTNPFTPDVFGQYESVRIAQKGAFWVQTSGAVAVGDPVHALAGGAIGNAGGTEIPNARFESATTGAGLAVVYLG